MLSSLVCICILSEKTLFIVEFEKGTPSVMNFCSIWLSGIHLLGIGFSFSPRRCEILILIPPHRILQKSSKVGVPQYNLIVLYLSCAGLTYIHASLWQALQQFFIYNCYRFIASVTFFGWKHDISPEFQGPRCSSLNFKANMVAGVLDTNGQSFSKMISFLCYRSYIHVCRVEFSSL